MFGTIKFLAEDKHYGFVKTHETDYFFHKSDFMDDWDTLCIDISNRIEVQVTFEAIRTDKGLRAERVRRADG